MKEILEEANAPLKTVEVAPLMICIAFGAFAMRSAPNLTRWILMSEGGAREIGENQTDGQLQGPGEFEELCSYCVMSGT